MKLILKLQSDYFFNLWVFLAVAVTFLNDRYFKSMSPPELNFLTGKLSDFCGLFFFPIFLVFLSHRLGRYKYNRQLIFWSCFTTTAQFILFKYVDVFKNTLIEIVSKNLFPIQIVSDPTDLVAMVSILGAYYFMEEYLPKNNITVQ